jgi:hypothetical protein
MPPRYTASEREMTHCKEFVASISASDQEASYSKRHLWLLPIISGIKMRKTVPSNATDTYVFTTALQ